MGAISIDHTIASANVHELFFVDIGNSTLVSLTLFAVDLVYLFDPAWCEIGILSGGVSLEQRVAILANGYVSKRNAVAWSGFIPVDCGSSVYCSIIGHSVNSYRLSAFVVPITTVFTTGGDVATK